MQSDQLLNLMFEGLGVLFKDRVVAPLIILPAFVAVAILFWAWALYRTYPWLRAAKTRIHVLKTVINPHVDSSAQRTAFSEQFATVSKAMSDTGSIPLTRAWHEYHETIVDETQSPILNTARPYGFFSRAVPSLQFLAFWSNVFVGAGLVLTFLGIVVALNAAAGGMSGDVHHMRDALVALLTVASSKFFASIGALIASLLLRFTEFYFQARIRRQVGQLSDLLERGLLYVSPQQLAVKQLDELKRQSAQLERFNSDLAITIGEQVGAQFQTAIAPMATSLGTLNDNIAGMTDSLRDGLGKGAADAVNAAASGELKALGNTLTGLQASIASIGETLRSSGGDAASQLRTAGADFAAAAARIQDGFGQLSQRIEGIGSAIVQESEQAAARQSAALEEAAKSLGRVQADTADSIARAVGELRQAGEASASMIREQSEAGVTKAAEDARTALKTAVAETAAAFTQAAQSMINSIGQSTDRMLTFASAIERSERGAAGTAEAFLKTTEDAQSAAAKLAEAAEGFRRASAPVIEATQAIREGISRLSGNLDAVAAARSGALDEVKALAGAMNQTSQSAGQAWKDYEKRFSQVDQDLRNTIDGLEKALTNAMTGFVKFAQDVDLQMSKAVTRFSDSLGSIEEHSETLSDFVDSIRTKNTLAAE